MANINGFTEAEIIRLLRLGLELAGDGGTSPWNEGEYEACSEYLNMLEHNLNAKNSVECYECHEIVHYTDTDIDNGHVICPCCGVQIILLD